MTLLRNFLPLSGHVRQSALLAAVLGIVSTLLTWFVYRVEECKDVFSGGLVSIFSCAGPILDRGFPLTWIVVVDLCPNPYYFCPVIPPDSFQFGLHVFRVLRLDWFGLAVDLLAWISLFGFLLMAVHKGGHT